MTWTASQTNIGGRRLADTRPRHVLACLVHEAPECVEDLVNNLRCLDPRSEILLYDGSPHASLLQSSSLPQRSCVNLYPDSKPMTWGRLHDFALDCMRFSLDELDANVLTIVDSDQLAVRADYSGYLAEFLAAHPSAGCLVTTPAPQPPSTQIGPARTAWAEIDLWRPFLRRFAGGEGHFPYWTFWPSTVFTRAAARDLLALVQDAELAGIISKSQIRASEEVILPSLVALTGHEVLRNPCSYEVVRYRVRYTPAQLDAAMRHSNVFWAHPIPRQYADALRTHIRARFNDYVTRPAKPSRLLQVGLPLLHGNDSVDRARLGTVRGREPSAPPLWTDVSPLVSCVMPTRGRREFVLQSIRYFQRQDYRHRELVIVDDGPDSLQSSLPRDPRVRYHHVARLPTLGAKRNRACELAAGEVIAQWDDDDWYAPGRLRTQVMPLISGAADVSALSDTTFVELDEWAFWRCTARLHRRLFVADVHGGTLVFKKDLWHRLARYPEASVGEDAAFLTAAMQRGARLKRLGGDGVFVYVRHGRNAWTFRCGEFVDPHGWRRVKSHPCRRGTGRFIRRCARPRRKERDRPMKTTSDQPVPIVVRGSGQRCGRTLVQWLVLSQPDVLTWGEHDGELSQVASAFERLIQWQPDYGYTARGRGQSLRLAGRRSHLSATSTLTSSLSTFRPAMPSRSARRPAMGTHLCVRCARCPSLDLA